MKTLSKEAPVLAGLYVGFKVLYVPELKVACKGDRLSHYVSDLRL